MKTKIKTNTAHNYNNTKKIINWSDYNKSLKNRGNLSIFISESIVKDGRIVVPPKTGKVGRPMEYTDELIEFVLTIRELFRLPLRQTTGFVEFLFKSMGIYSSAPDYTTVSKRMAIIKVRYQKKMDKYIKNGDGIVLLIDSSGFKVFGEGEWKVRKHGASKRRTWRETHVVINHETRDIMGFTNTVAHTYDNTQLKPLLEQVSSEGYNIDTIIGDGAYEVKDNYKLVAKFNASIIAPPHKNAIFHYDLKDGKLIDMPGYERRNKVIELL